MRSLDPGTRATRDAANVAGLAVVVFAGMWFASTQVRDIREWSPFAEDPWDAVMTYAAIFLPFVAGPTWIRSLAHREPVLRASTARRIRWGSGLASAIVLIAAAADLQAIVTLGFPGEVGPAQVVLAGLVVLTVVLGAVSILMIGRAGRRAPGAGATGSFEPDTIDDLVAIARDVALRVVIARPIARAALAVERFLDASRLSPRRHRIAFGVVLAVASAAAYDVWHAIREGPWANDVAPVVFGTLLGSGVLAIYLGTVGPLRLLRPIRG